MKGANILMVEDDINLGFLVKENLEAKGYAVQLCENGVDGLKAFKKDQFNLCILDVMMPLKDGFTLAKEIRGLDAQTPIIFLTAKALEKDKIEGFMLGGDDYITKPFSVKELMLRINAILKRTHKERSETSTGSKALIGKFTFDHTNRLLTIGATTKNLSTKEAELLKILSDNKNALVNRSVILTRVWGNDDFFIAKSMDVYLTRLRKLLRDDPAIEIQNLYGTGFKLVIKS